MTRTAADATTEAESSKRRRVRQRLRGGAFLLPGLFTVGNIVLGFMAVTQGLRGRFDQAVLLIFFAAVLDALDGRIARMTGTESEFGKEFDSLADVLTFGMSPALLTYFWGLEDGQHLLGRAGWLIPAFFLICTATRLARFNVQIKLVDSRYFVGLPTPAAAGGVCAALFTLPVPSSFDDPQVAKAVTTTLLAVVFLLGALMVSNFRYPSFKRLDLQRRRSYRLMLPVAVLLLLAAWRPAWFFVGIAAVYTLAGPTNWLLGRRWGAGKSPTHPQETPPS